MTSYQKGESTSTDDRPLADDQLLEDFEIDPDDPTPILFHISDDEEL